MVSHRQPIISAALERFATDGFGATSVQHIADSAGVSKATVLYHFTSKDELLGQALGPTLEAFEALVSEFDSIDGVANPELRHAFIERFVPFLLTHRLGIHIVVTHSHLASHHPALARATALMGRIAAIVERSSTSELDALRFGVALSGATYSLVSETLLGLDRSSHSDLENGLKVILSEMLLPLSDSEVR